MAFVQKHMPDLPAAVVSVAELALDATALREAKVSAAQSATFSMEAAHTAFGRQPIPVHTGSLIGVPGGAVSLICTTDPCVCI